MKSARVNILQIATLFTPEGKFGGPTRVAQDQTKGLIRTNHNVLLAGAGTGFGSRMPERLEGTPVQLFPSINIGRRGFAGTVSPGFYWWLWNNCRKFDVVHVHFARDLITLPAALIVRRRGVPMVLQTHGMVVVHRSMLVRIFDRLVTSRILSAADRVLGLTNHEVSELTAICGNRTIRTRTQPNGVNVAEPIDELLIKDEVLFVARLHPRKGAILFVEAAKYLIELGHTSIFTLIGPDEGEGKEIASLISNFGSDQIRWLGGLKADLVDRHISSSMFVVLPSKKEPFGMTIIEAMSNSKPVVISDDAEIASIVEGHGAGIIAERTVMGMAAAMEILIGDKMMRFEMGKRGHSLVAEEFSLDAVVSNLENDYMSVLALNRSGNVENN
ncbi:glycosyltransferase [Arthrobacter glacialis]|uniref:D-inositol 3-phosphate glycosyltransferase n=1 Tax=Arthrobacter glacialis TaxID=1664 RepID=A0A2S4A0M1_ARTGL|nr:glycosyltransferase [Arthrobacter glacialis]POH74904.1 glycosyl transferase family 1 [Arthrobacter glacialis]